MSVALPNVPSRLLRNPRKYLSRNFWGMVAREGFYRGRAALFYTVPSVVRSAGRKRESVFVYPQPMNRYQFAETYVAWKVFFACDLRISRRSDGAAVAIAWHPSTEYSLDESAFANLPETVRVLNCRCTDIRKTRVGECFARVFGYSLEVDPLSYSGTMLRKPELNGTHDIQLLEGPLQTAEPGYVYQRVITYDTPKGLAEWRVFIVGARPVAVYTLYAPHDERFAYWRERAEMTTIDDTFTPEEQQRIASFCVEIGLDFGVLDILRDGQRGRIYISDCNNTPTGPSPTLNVFQQVRLVRHLARHFKSEYLQAR